MARQQGFIAHRQKRFMGQIGPVQAGTVTGKEDDSVHKISLVKGGSGRMPVAGGNHNNRLDPRVPTIDHEA